MASRHPGMSFSLGERTEVPEALLEAIGESVPAPSWHRGELHDPREWKLAVAVILTLAADPPTQAEAPLDVAGRHPGMSLSLDERAEVPEPLFEALLPVHVEAPGPPRHALQRLHSFGLEAAAFPLGPQPAGPPPKWESLFDVSRWDAGVAFPLDELPKKAQSLLESVLALPLEGIPGPSRDPLEGFDCFCWKPPTVVVVALTGNPGTEPKPRFLMSRGHLGVTLTCDEAPEHRDGVAEAKSSGSSLLSHDHRCQ